MVRVERGAWEEVNKPVETSHHMLASPYMWGVGDHPRVPCVLSPIKWQSKGFPLIVCSRSEFGVPFLFIVFICCFIVKPSETVIVIRGCNKLDLL